MFEEIYLKLSKPLCLGDVKTASSKKLYGISMQICREFPDAVEGIYQVNQGDDPSGSISIKPSDDINVVAAMLEASFSKVSSGNLEPALRAAQGWLSQLRDERDLRTIFIPVTPQGYQ